MSCGQMNYRSALRLAVFTVFKDDCFPREASVCSETGRKPVRKEHLFTYVEIVLGISWQREF